MNIEFKHNLNKGTVKDKIESEINKLNNLKLSGGYTIEDLKKYWIGDDLQVSFKFKKMVIDRKVEGFIKVKDTLLVIDIELPDIIYNLITEENLKKTINRNLITILKKT